MLIPPEIFDEIQELVELQDHLYDLCEENFFYASIQHFVLILKIQIFYAVYWSKSKII